MSKEPASIFNKSGGHYNIFSDVSMETLKTVFPKGEANEMNFVLFSTSGVHGTYRTIEDIEERLRGSGFNEYGEPVCTGLTTLVIQPRLVNMMFGEIEVTLEDIEFLKKLRDSSKKVIMEIGGEAPSFAVAYEALNAENKKLKEECAELKSDLLLSVKEKCEKYHIQDCINCLHVDCCDNINPLKGFIKKE